MIGALRGGSGDSRRSAEYARLPGLRGTAIAQLAFEEARRVAPRPGETGVAAVEWEDRLPPPIEGRAVALGRRRSAVEVEFMGTTVVVVLVALALSLGSISSWR